MKILKCRRKRKPEPKSIIFDKLPEDVLCKIFSHLDRFDLKSTSIVCKLFCSVSSSLVRGLLLKDSSVTYSQFQRLFKRFLGVKMICICNFDCLDALSAISNSRLNLEKLHLKLIYYGTYAALLYPALKTIENMSTSASVIKAIKSLALIFFKDASKQQTVMEFVNMLPSLTELDFSFYFDQWNDERIHNVTSKLPNLRKIDLSFNRGLTDKTLAVLSSNCPKLESVKLRGCKNITSEALYKFFSNNPQLSSVNMPYFCAPSISKVVEGLQVLTNLNHLSLDIDHFDDAALIGLAKLRLPLKSLVMHNTCACIYTSIGLSQLLSAFPGLESLQIDLRHRKYCNTDDAEMSILVKRLPNLKHIRVWSDFVCQATLFSLVQNCPLLETISLHQRCSDQSQVEQVYYDQIMTVPAKKNHSIRSIAISKKSDIWLLSAIELYCPNLRK